MKRFLACLALLASAFPAFAIDAASVWPVATPPSGTNPALFAVPRQEWLEKFQRNLAQAHGTHFDLVFDGDSITDFFPGIGKPVWTAHYGALSVIDFGIGGDRIEHLLWRLQEGQLDGVDPKLVVLMIGTNNTGRDSADRIAEGIKNLVGEYEKRAPNAHFLLLGVFPRSALPADPIRAKIADINKQIAALDGDRVTYMDIGAKFLEPDGALKKELFMPDCLHPVAAGYAVWADAIQPVVDRYVPAPAKN